MTNGLLCSGKAGTNHHIVLLFKVVCADWSCDGTRIVEIYI